MHNMTHDQLRMARAALNWTIDALASESSVSRNTIARAERGEKVFQSTLTALKLTLEAAGVEFIPENGGGPGVRLKRP